MNPMIATYFSTSVMYYLYR